MLILPIHGGWKAESI